MAVRLEILSTPEAQPVFFFYSIKTLENFKNDYHNFFLILNPDLLRPSIEQTNTWAWDYLLWDKLSQP